jgi:glycosyltransferase involved in cell wall biosynthesis
MSSSRMRVLQVGKFYPPHMGGIETHMQVLCRELQSEIDLEVLVANDSPRDEVFREGQVKITRVGTRFAISGAPVCPSLPAKIRRARADIVHLHLPNPPAILALLASGYRGAVITTYHSDIVRQERMAKLFDPILHAFLKRCAAIVVTSARYRDSSPVLTRYVDKCRVIPYGIPLESFRCCDAAAVARIRAQYGSRLVISTGRLIYYKGFEYLVEAMGQVDGHLLIAGDGPLRPTLEMQTQTLGLQHKITFLGEIHNDHMPPFYHAADLFALASVARSEAFGIVQLEAMACGKPVVNTNLDSGTPWVSPDGVTGITVPPKDPVALARAITKLLDDEDLRNSYGEAARLRVEKEFNQDLMIARMLETYREVLRGRVAHEELSLTESPTPVKRSAPEVGASTSI